MKHPVAQARGVFFPSCRNYTAMKNFNAWNETKQQLDHIDHRPPFVSEGDIWWVSIGENIGAEVGGKSRLFSRPAIIFKKLAQHFYLVIPTTTREKIGSWYVPFSQGGVDMRACLHQIRAMDYRRLSTKLGMLEQQDRAKIKIAFAKLYL